MHIATNPCLSLAVEPEIAVKKIKQDQSYHFFSGTPGSGTAIYSSVIIFLVALCKEGVKVFLQLLQYFC